jgi:hypothetical protein
MMGPTFDAISSVVGLDLRLGHSQPQVKTMRRFGTTSGHRHLVVVLATKGPSEPPEAFLERLPWSHLGQRHDHCGQDLRAGRRAAVDHTDHRLAHGRFVAAP